MENVENEENKTAEYWKDYYRKNKDVMDARSKEWKNKNREYWNAFQARYARIRYTKKKLKDDPTNEVLLRKLQQLEQQVIRYNKL